MLDTVTLGDDIDLTRFDQIGKVAAFRQSTREEAIERLKQYNPEIVINNKVPFDREVLSASPSLRMIAETATGYNNIDLEYAKLRGIRVANVAGYSTQSVIQHTFALLFYVLEKLAYYDQYVKSGAYVNSPCFTHFDKVFPELFGKTWGIVGLGAIGRGVAAVAKAFGCQVIYYSASGRRYDTEYECVSFEDLLRRSDVISIHAPLNAQTNNLFCYETFQKMKRTAILLNLGRGPIVNDADLAKALQEGLLAGAGLDVITREPIEKDNPLLLVSDSTRLVITPHIAWATYEARSRLLDEVYENIAAFLRGEERNVVV